jgi:hypothetical protein
MPAGWFKGVYPILIAFCRHVCRARLLEKEIAKPSNENLSADDDVQSVNRLLAMAERETRAIVNCARQLRLTPQSRIQPRSAGRAADDMTTGTPPWEE